MTLTCDRYNLNSKTWQSITSLPETCTSMTAALFNKDIIILSGYRLDCCYSYNNSVYEKIISLPTTYKIVCEGWILANSTLYENRSQNILKWTNYNVNNPWK